MCSFVVKFINDMFVDMRFNKFDFLLLFVYVCLLIKNKIIIIKLQLNNINIKSNADVTWFSCSIVV